MIYLAFLQDFPLNYAQFLEVITPLEVLQLYSYMHL